MGLIHDTQVREADPASVRSARRRPRLIGIDAARGLALIGLIAVHILPAEIGDTGDPSLVFRLFFGHSAALFAFLAGVGLALSTGGQRPHRGQRMAGNRLGLAARSVLIGVVALGVAEFMGSDPPGILLYYTVFFLLAMPFLHLAPKALFLSAAAFAVLAPVLLQHLGPVLPDWSSSNPTLGDIFSEPGAVASQLLLTGTYPALTYVCYLLAGLGIGRLDLRNTSHVTWIAGVGAALAILAHTTSSLLLFVAGGYDRLLQTPGMTAESLNEALVWGPETVADTSPWWLALVTPHTNMPLSIAASLGLALLVTALFLLVAQKVGRALKPLAVMGTMTLTLYTAHLLALSVEVHYEEPFLWFLVHLLTAAAFAMIWSRWVGRGPLEAPIGAAAANLRQIVDPPAAGGSAT